MCHTRAVVSCEHDISNVPSALTANEVMVLLLLLQHGTCARSSGSESEEEQEIADMVGRLIETYVWPEKTRSEQWKLMEAEATALALAAVSDEAEYDGAVKSTM